VITLIPVNAAPELVLWQKIHYLSENSLAYIHDPGLSALVYPLR
jgi:hypothetical protein